jgi:NADPH-dependent glutamate synthase beta subunit-like oxidoreductase
MAIEKWTQFHCAAIKTPLFNSMEWIPHSLRLNGKKIATPSEGEETDGINLSHDVVIIVELKDGMRIAIKAIHFHGSATGRLEKKRSRIKLQQEHEV